jgi:cadmium resistance protein CadD (predicted permease)
MVAGLPAEIALAAGAFLSTNIDNALVSVAMVAAAPPARAKRIAYGQVFGFVVIILVAVATAIALFDVPTKAIGLLGFVPLVLGIHGLLALRHAEGRERVAKRAFGTGFFAAALVTIGAGGDNLAVYIPLFRVSSGVGRGGIALVFVVGEVLLTWFILRAGRHPRTRAVAGHIGMIAAPLLYCAIGVLVLVEANTFSFLF